MSTVIARTGVPSRARIAICIATVVACVPYAALKVAWIAGSDIGTADAEAAELMHDSTTVVANVLTLGLELGAVVIVAALTFVRRIPPLLLIGPIWVGTGLLAPIALGLPVGLAAQGLAGGAPAPDDSGLHGWVYALVYGGFIVQAPLLIGAFVLHVSHRWPWAFRLRGNGVTRGTTYSLQLLMARTGLTAAAALAVVYVLWTVDAAAFSGPTGLETVAQRTTLAVRAALPIAGALGVLALVRGRGDRPLLVPLAAAWVGSAAAFATVILPTNGPSAFESYVAGISGATGLGLAITALLVLTDARPPDSGR